MLRVYVGVEQKREAMACMVYILCISQGIAIMWQGLELYSHSQ